LIHHPFTVDRFASLEAPLAVPVSGHAGFARVPV